LRPKQVYAGKEMSVHHGGAVLLTGKLGTERINPSLRTASIFPWAFLGIVCS
jgi:hypothetical protein